MKYLLCLLIAVTISGCISAPPVQTLTPDQIASKTTIIHDDFKKNTLLNGMPLGFDNLGLDNFYLSAFKKDSTTNISFDLTFRAVRSSDEGWAFWGSAVDQDGKEFETTIVSRDLLDGGLTSEMLDVTLTRPYLESKRLGGVNIRIDGQRTSQAVNLPPNYIDGFLREVDAVFPANN
jgi:hypothetical protein